MADKKRRGAASHGDELVFVALGGLGLMVDALEARAGTVRLAGPGGRVQAFPRLAVGFALFGAAGVAMPGTAGFIADDLLLHKLLVAPFTDLIATGEPAAIGCIGFDDPKVRMVVSDVLVSVRPPLLVWPADVINSQFR